MFMYIFVWIQYMEKPKKQSGRNKWQMWVILFHESVLIASNKVEQYIIITDGDRLSFFAIHYHRRTERAI